MSDKEFLEHSNNTNSMESAKSTEEVTNADMFSLLKTYMNDKSPGTEKNLNDRAFDLDKKKMKKAEPSFRFKGNQVQIELNAEISDSINVVLSELGRNNVRKAVLLLEDSLAVLNKRNKTIQDCGQVRTSMENRWRAYIRSC